MTREEQIIETAKEYYNPKNGTPFSLQMRAGFITGAKWADETMIEKACEWLDNNAEDFTIDGGLSIECLIYSFKKVMEE